jgi:hypothetical protein
MKFKIVTVDKISGKQTNESELDFADQAHCDAYVAEMVAKNVWGKKSETTPASVVHHVGIPAMPAIAEVLDPTTGAVLSPAIPAIPEVLAFDETIPEKIIPAEYNLIVTDVTAQYILQARIDLLEASGVLNEELCKKCLAIITGHNKERMVLGTLTLPQLQSMLSTYSSILTCLQSNMPQSAKALISAITPDGVVVVQELKDLLLAVLG